MVGSGLGLRGRRREGSARPLTRRKRLEDQGGVVALVAADVERCDWRTTQSGCGGDVAANHCQVLEARACFRKFEQAGNIPAREHVV